MGVLQNVISATKILVSAQNSSVELIKTRLLKKGKFSFGGAELRSFIPNVANLHQFMVNRLRLWQVWPTFDTLLTP